MREMYEKCDSVIEMILLYNRARNFEKSNSCKIIAMACLLMKFRLTLQFIIIFKHLHTITQSKIYFLFNHIIKLSTLFNDVT